MAKSFWKTPHAVRPLLLIYDVIAYVLSACLLFVALPLVGSGTMKPLDKIAVHIVIGVLCMLLSRAIWRVYAQIWRYGGASAYLRLVMADGCAGVVYYLIQRFVPFVEKILFVHLVAIVCISLLLALTMRLAYYWLYQNASRVTWRGNIAREILRVFALMKVNPDEPEDADYASRIRIAIVGAGRVGTSLAEDLAHNPRANYIPVCYIDADREKVGRIVGGLQVLSTDEATAARLKSLRVQEIVIALPQLTTEEKAGLYNHYKKTGCRIKIYDYPSMQQAGSNRRALREFAIEDLLFRQPVEFSDEATTAYYSGKTILITGGGGSIGSELCRQIAKMRPKKLVILDVYENCAYDIQQELRIKYGGELDMQVEICSVCDRRALEKVFAVHRPEIVLNAAAHKHVPLMEHNVVEAVKNNVFGTLNTVQMAEKYGAKRFIMISTDKAVTPTNVMGATKRMCEMLILSRAAANTGTVYSATRFGNVLGSAGSVIPLFRKQIAAGGPVTLTDKRIIRYFMTIPEASQLVLQSGAMAKNGELFVLDMGKPVKILELAENMIRLSGYEPYRDIEIREIGLRPGEKLYEELLIKSETLTKTDNKLIFIERDAPLTTDEIAEKLRILHDAVETEDDDKVREALHRAVPTFKTPEEVNAEAMNTNEMKIVKEEEAEKA